MNPTAITYLGFFVAALIVIWAAVEMTHRFYKSRKINTHSINAWTPLRPSSEVETENEKREDNISLPRAQHNGHYSESKKL